MLVHREAAREEARVAGAAWGERRRVELREAALEVAQPRQERFALARGPVLELAVARVHALLGGVAREVAPQLVQRFALERGEKIFGAHPAAL